VVIVVIGMLSGIMLAALRKAQQAARLTHTKATIAKLDRIIMAKYESYRTRRLPLNIPGLQPRVAALLRLYALRDLMRMEMPEMYAEIQSGPMDVGTPAGVSQLNLPEPALHRIYGQKMTAQPVDHESPKCLYLIVMTGNPENRALFSQDEIADVDGDGLLSFIDGWGHPIAYLRWAPGFSAPLPGSPPPAGVTAWSDIQIADSTNHHDPFDPRGVEPGAYQLFPLIYAGVISHDSQGDHYGVQFGGWKLSVDPYIDTPGIGAVQQGFPISNHHMEQR
jgi:hypothetical protein